nr:hypothetical protein [Candidatus Accumulibacter sp. ACC003]
MVLDYIGKRCRFEFLFGGLVDSVVVRVPEAIAVPRTLKLLNQYRSDELADTGTRDMIFTEPSDPRVDIINVTIDTCKSLLEGHIGSHVREGFFPGQSVGFAAAVVRRKAMVSTPLDVKGHQIKELRTDWIWGVEKEAANVIDDVVVYLLHTMVSQTIQ